MKCKLCGTDINGASASNIVPHMKRKHVKEYSEYIALESEENINIRRFSTLSCSGFLASHQSILEQLKAAGRPINLKDEHLREVKQHLNSMTAKVREKIKTEVNGKLLSPMIDGATRNNRSLLGISVQYNYNSQVKVATLGVKEVIERSTSANLCAIVKNTLEEYGIHPHAAISVTADNAANMIATIHELEIELNKTIMQEVDVDSIEIAESQSDNAGDTQIHENEHLTNAIPIDDEIQNTIDEQETNDEDILNHIFDESVLHESLLNSVGENLIGEIAYENFIDDVRCAIHTLQLAVKDAIELLARADANVILLCRNIAKFLRLKSSQIEMRKKNILIVLPVLDVETRWNSTYALASIAIL